MRVTVKEPEEVDVLEVKGKQAPDAKAERVKKKLLRVEFAADKVKVDGRPQELPAMTVWLDKDREVVRRRRTIPGLGRFTVFRTTQAVAEEEGAAPALMPDLLHQQPHPARSGHPPSARGEGSGVPHHAQGRRRPGLRVRPGRPPEGDERRRTMRSICTSRRCVRRSRWRTPTKPGEEYLKSSYFLDSANDKIKAMAAEAVGDETDPWRKRNASKNGCMNT